MESNIYKPNNNSDGFNSLDELFQEIGINKTEIISCMFLTTTQINKNYNPKDKTSDSNNESNSNFLSILMGIVGVIVVSLIGGAFKAGMKTVIQTSTSYNTFENNIVPFVSILAIFSFIIYIFFKVYNVPHNFNSPSIFILTKNKTFYINLLSYNEDKKNKWNYNSLFEFPIHFLKLKSEKSEIDIICDNIRIFGAFEKYNKEIVNQLSNDTYKVFLNKIKNTIQNNKL